MRKIPKKNYIFLSILSVVTILFSVYVMNWYKTSKEYSAEESLMTDFLGEVKESEIENYILENPEVVIYVASEQNENIKKFEKKLKEYLIKEDLKSHFIYLNCNNLSSDFITTFQKKYFNGALKKVYFPYPNLWLVDDGEVVDVLYRINQELDIKDVDQFLKKNGVTNDA